MAFGNKTGGKDFKPGQSGNPNGRPALPDDIKAARKLNKQALDRMLDEFMNMSIVELEARVRRPEATAIEIMVAKVVEQAIKKGDQQRLGFLLDRLVGPVKRAITLEGGDDDSNPIRVGQPITKEERAELIRYARGEASGQAEGTGRAIDSGIDAEASPIAGQSENQEAQSAGWNGEARGEDAPSG